MPGQGWESIYQNTWKGLQGQNGFKGDNEFGSEGEVEEWGNGGVVRHEKTGMLVKVC